MSATIIVMPGVERRDMAGPATASADVLCAAIDQGVNDVVVIGRDRAGDLYMAAATPDVDRTVGMLMRAVAVLSDCKIVNDVELGGDPPCDV
jgi:hypothetical protein